MDTREFPISEVRIMRNPWVASILFFVVIGGGCIYASVQFGLNPVVPFVLFMILVNLAAAAVRAGMLPFLLDRRKKEKFHFADGALCWSAGRLPLESIRRVVLFTKPHGDVRRMRIAARGIDLSFPNSTGEYKPLADRLRKELPEKRCRVREI